MLRKRMLWSGLCGWLLVGALVPSSADGRGHETLSVNEASRIGMVAAWQRHLSISGGLDGVVDTELFVDREAKKQYVEVQSDGKVLFRLSADEAGDSGAPIGLEEAKRRALIETYKLKRRGIESAISVREVPEVRLYALGGDGTIECRDAEDGRLLWVERYGNPRIRCLPMAVNDQFVTFVNANQLYVLNADTGELITQKILDAVPLYGPALVGDYIMCVCTGGRVTGYWTRDFQRQPFVGRAAGLPMAAPVTDPSISRTVWPTDEGYLYAIDGAGEAGMAFRFRPNGLVSAPVATGGAGRFFAGSEKGQLYALDGSGTGNVMWRKSLGGPIYGSPTVLGDRVVVRTAYGKLFCVDVNSGQFSWNSPVGRVEKVLGGDEEQVLVRLNSSHLASINLNSGAVMVDLSATEISESVRNPYTDRLYLISSSGTIQCLRPVASELPRLLETEYSTPDSADAKPAAEQPQEEEKQDGGFGFGEDPDDDPFGGGGDDPFGGGDDPFGGGGTGGEDPFDFGSGF